MQLEEKRNAAKNSLASAFPVELSKGTPKCTKVGDNFLLS